MSISKQLSTLAIATLCYSPVQILAATVNANADSYIQSTPNNANDNFGSSEELLLKNAASGTSFFNRKTYIRFDLSSFTNTPFIDATFSLTISDSSRGDAVAGSQNFSVYGLNDGDAGENWGENAITWNNAPQNNTAPSSGAGVLGNTTFLSSFIINGIGTPGDIINVGSAALLSFLNDDTNNLATFIIVRDTFDNNPSGWVHSFASKENSIYNGPLLDITESPVNAVPLPHTLMLMFSALGAIGWKRRAKSSI